MEKLEKKQETFSRIDVMNTPFSIIKNNENGKCKIAIGNNLASEREFEKIEQARLYINKKPWDLIVNCIFAMYINIKLAEQYAESNEKQKTKEN